MNVDIAKNLADRRRAAGYSQEALAAELGVSRQAVSKWERSESSPDTDNLIALAGLYGVVVDDLLYTPADAAGPAASDAAPAAGPAREPRDERSSRTTPEANRPDARASWKSRRRSSRPGPS